MAKKRAQPSEHSGSPEPAAKKGKPSAEKPKGRKGDLTQDGKAREQRKGKHAEKLKVKKRSGEVEQKEGGKKGGLAALTPAEEQALVECILEKSEAGLSVGRSQIAEKVKEIFKERKLPFKDGVPGRRWWLAFKKRHPQLAEKEGQSLEREQSEAVNAEVV